MVSALVPEEAEGSRDPRAETRVAKGFTRKEVRWNHLMRLGRLPSPTASELWGPLIRSGQGQAALVVQGLSLLPMQGAQLHSLVGELDSAHHVEGPTCSN